MSWPANGVIKPHHIELQLPADGEQPARLQYRKQRFRAVGLSRGPARRLAVAGSLGSVAFSVLVSWLASFPATVAFHRAHVALKSVFNMVPGGRL